MTEADTSSLNRKVLPGQGGAHRRPSGRTRRRRTASNNYGKQEPNFTGTAKAAQRLDVVGPEPLKVILQMTPRNRIRHGT